jgi:hypothetical protein
MFTFGSRLPRLGLAIVATAALAAGCGASSSDHQATSASTTSAPSSSVPSTKPARSSSVPSSVPSTAGAPSTTVAPSADLGALKQQLDVAGSSLGAAGTALAQSDPNQTKNEEGTTP